MLRSLGAVLIALAVAGPAAADHCTSAASAPSDAARCSGQWLIDDRAPPSARVHAPQSRVKPATAVRRGDGVRLTPDFAAGLGGGVGAGVECCACTHTGTRVLITAPHGAPRSVTARSTQRLGGRVR